MINPVFKCMLSCGFVLMFSHQALANWYSDSQGIMGTNIHTEIWAESPESGDRAVAAVMVEMERINQLMSPYIEQSELSKINRQAPLKRVTISK